MSSKILFENIDKTVDYGGYPNRFPVHLKNMAISGLPADEVPIIEIRDIHGQVYNSNHADSEVPTWSVEFGDGSFQVSNDILGDFVLSCRFGGKHAAIKDSSTVIFTYQNNTGQSRSERVIRIPFTYFCCAVFVLFIVIMFIAVRCRCRRYNADQFIKYYWN